MKIYDLTHLIHKDMPVYPGTSEPVLKEVTTVIDDGYKETEISIYSHVGTHMDAPAHMIKDGMTLDEYPVDYFLGNGRLVLMSQINVFSESEIQELVEGIDYLFIKTNQYKRWGGDSYFKDFDCLNPNVTKVLATTNLKGIGVDTISVDPIGNEFPNHFHILGAGKVIIENIKMDLNEEFFEVMCFPNKYKNIDGSQVRVVVKV